jgi:hypothetical protein
MSVFLPALAFSTHPAPRRKRQFGVILRTGRCRRVLSCEGTRRQRIRALNNSEAQPTTATEPPVSLLSGFRLFAVLNSLSSFHQCLLVSAGCLVRARVFDRSDRL